MEYVKILITPDGRLSRRDSASFLGISAKTLANRATRGLAPRPVKVGGRCFYWLADLQAFVAGQGVRR